IATKEIADRQPPLLLGGDLRGNRAEYVEKWRRKRCIDRTREVHIWSSTDKTLPFYYPVLREGITVISAVRPQITAKPGKREELIESGVFDLYIKVVVTRSYHAVAKSKGRYRKFQRHKELGSRLEPPVSIHPDIAYHIGISRLVQKVVEHYPLIVLP